MTVKRSREDGEVEEVESLATANGLMLLSHVSQTMSSYPDRLFECKTCSRKFTSFQALGGHRASHKKPKLLTTDLLHLENQSKSKTHKCSICHLEFAIGQALGGHMRRHRVTAVARSEGLATENKQSAIPTTVLKKSNSKRVMCLDLNLTPYENWVKLEIGKIARMLDCHL